MVAGASADGLLRVAISVEVTGGSPQLVEVTASAGAHTGDVLDALGDYLGLTGATGATLAQSLLTGGWLPRERPLGSSGLLRGERLRLSVGLAEPSGAAPLTRWSGPARAGDARGCVPVPRPPRTPGDETVLVVPVPGRPAAASRRRFPVGTIAIPLVIGVALFVVTRRVEIILFSLFSPVMMLWNVIEERRARSVDTASGLVGHDAAVHAAEQRIRARTWQWSRWLRFDHPSPDELGQLVEQGSPRIWERRPGDVDFLRVRLGSATRAAPVDLREDGRSPSDEPTRHRLQTATLAPDVPALLSLPATGALALLAAPADVAAALRWVLAQIVTWHSPRDVTLVAAAPAVERGWLQWLPQVAMARLDPALAIDADDARILLSAVDQLIRTRVDARADAAAVVLVVDDRVRVDPVLLARVLEDGPAVGVYVIWSGSDPHRVPGQISATVAWSAAGAELVDHRSGQRTVLIPDALSGRDADLVAARLAPLMDATMDAAGAETLPERVSLEQLQPELDSPGARRRDWPAAPPEHLRAVLGVGVGGPVSIELGPRGSHVLIGGTTGSGKSELLQTMVASLAAQYPPDRVAFLLVDYKGGAAFKDAVYLPHTVGLVTDLDPHMTRRVLVALDAEIRRREEVLRAAGARDLPELRRRDPGHALEELVIVVDEFATLAKEVPEFVDGVVDVAARGRSLGLRLVLATQRPAGVISDRIRANVATRIALRVNDESDSLDVIDAPDAAHISRATPGRAYLRSGGQLIEFQSAFVGGPVQPADAAITVRPWGLGRRFAGPLARVDGGPSALKAVVASATQVMRLGRWSAPHVPWLPPLPNVVELTALWAEHDAASAGAPAPGPGATSVVLGRSDQPAQQRQQLVALDLDRHQHLLVYGTSRSGKTTVLRTLAAGLVRGYPPAKVQFYVLDFAGQGLAVLARAPQCGGVISGSDVARVARLLRRLRRLVDQRSQWLGRAGATDYADACAADPELAWPRIVVFVDSYAGASAALERVDGGRLLDQLNRLIADGAGVGLHFVITADRRAAVPSALTGIITTRLVLRMAERDDYALLGVPGAELGDATRAPGRGVLSSGIEVQVAALGAEPTASAQAEAFAALADEVAGRVTGRAPQIESLPDAVARTELPDAPDALTVALGVGADELQPWWVRLAQTHFLVSGPRRSGRSTAVATVACGLARASNPAAVLLVAPARSPLHELDLWTDAVRDPQDQTAVAALIGRAEELLADNRVVVVCADDAEEYPDPVSAALERLAASGRDRPVRLIAATDNRAALRAYSGLLAELRRGKHGLLLAPEIDVDGDLLGVRLRPPVDRLSVPGRGFAVADGGYDLVQVAR